MSLVLDSSVTLAWLYSDELTLATQEVFDQVVAAGARVPSLWRLEVANSLQGGIRRGRINEEFRDAALTDLGLLDIAIDSDTDTFAWSTTLRLAERCGLNLYEPPISNWPSDSNFLWPHWIRNCVPREARSALPCSPVIGYLCPRVSACSGRYDHILELPPPLQAACG